MTCPRWALATSASLLLGGCGGGQGSSPSSPPSPSPPSVDNVQPLQVNLGPAGALVNGLFTSVTICVPGTSNCQTIDGIQVDTGSVGLRILSSRVSLPLQRLKDASGNPVGNCATFADNSYAWGPVELADVQMAGEKAPSVPIQVITTSGFPAAPSICRQGNTPADTVSALGANGLLGIGVFREDCGPACGVAGPRLPPLYFSCPNAGCSPTAVALQSQLQNPVWLFPQDNNGVLVSVPAIPATGARSVAGSLIFGIGTQANNALGGARVYTTDAQGNISTVFKGKTITSSYLDTGSNGYFFLDSATIGLPACPNADGFSCPHSTVSYGATTTGQNGASGQVSFSVANAEALFNTGNTAFDNLAGPDSGDFDWGMPFFFGRNTFIAIEGQGTPGGAGPYFAY
jgi:hypothetical protein